MKIVVITACTGEKAVDHERRLTLDDFEAGPEHLEGREAELAPLALPAEALYTGSQHLRLMRGVQALREARGDEVRLELSILSAGYGLVDAQRRLVPYEATFQGMARAALRRRAEALGLPGALRGALADPYDLGLLLLGDDYLRACQLDETVALGGPTLALCGAKAARRLPALGGELSAITLGNGEARRFGCALVGLKGELAGRMLSRIAAAPEMACYLGAAQRWELLDLLDDRLSSQPPPARGRRANPRAYRTARLSGADRRGRELRYFIPEWDDLVDPDYDFEGDRHWGGTGDWSNQVYAHQLFDEPQYDGVLISRSVSESTRRKRERIERLGVRRYLRLPRGFPIMGDCGAFNYRDLERPPYSTPELVEFYTRLDFDYGVSIDHLIITDSPATRRFRYELTIENARDFLAEHRALAPRWQPIGAVQGWDEASYTKAAKSYAKMGYRYLGLGGLVRSRTKQVLAIVEAVRRAVPGLDLHVFGIARLEALGDFRRLGVRSVDSASALRQAWMRTETSYLLPREGEAASQEAYAALRVPETSPSFCRRALGAHPELTEASLKALEAAALDAVRAFSRGGAPLEETLEALIAYDRHVTGDRVDMTPHYRRTLEARPWERCRCPICRAAGVEVLIFRGNNRNRRRGFHNTHVFYELLRRSLGQR